ncbi:hypothetical protein DFQ05_1757 [Winogradskyella wandonensis]|uniref:Prophage protein DUF1660 n=1 Tax=Winogradskyella wandonensis TaxID=1442586 RepID=A0A4R1KTW9_9FLAO|nr:hypothetical protein [Winogradskyella wandonensis]TCK67973.1 hypothetical protein DFQ05_1757 [Winogradskyella wandonensis]
MKSSTRPNLPQRFYCDLFGHNYKVTKDVTEHVKEYTCACCKRELTTNGNGRLTELTPKFREINATLARIYSNKLARMRARRFETSAA